MACWHPRSSAYGQASRRSSQRSWAVLATSPGPCSAHTSWASRRRLRRRSTPTWGTASLSPSSLASCLFDQAACWASSCRRRSDMTFVRTHRTMATIIAFVLVYVVIKSLNLTGILNAYYIQLIILAGINIVMTVSLGMVNGFTGQFSIGHAGFMAVGAYTSVSYTHLRAHETRHDLVCRLLLEK